MNSLPQPVSSTHEPMQREGQSGSKHSKQLRYQIDLLRHLVWRDFSLRYKQSALGILWSLVLPFAQLIVMVFLFGSVVPLNIEAYPAFVFCALLPWSWFSSSLSSACGLFMGNRDLVRHPNFTPARLMVVNTISNLITYLVALPILIAVLLVYGRPLTLALLALPLLMLIQGVLTVGLSLVIATLNVFYRDVQHIVVVVLMLLFYLTPVFYRPQSVSERYHLIYKLNPAAVLIQGYRSIFFESTFPAWDSLLFVAVAAIIAYGLGSAVYQRHQHDIIDTI
jgi:ABC-type polysaccharide/polyol phosphate export permease